MALARQTDATLVRPLGDARGVRRVTLGDTVEAGELISEQSDGYWDPAAGGTVTLTVAVALQGGVAGDRIPALFWGPCTAITGATPGTLVYVSNTAGEPGATAGTKSTIVGFAEAANILFVQPQVVDLV